MGITLLPNAPFYTGTSLSSLVPTVLPAAIAGHAYVLELSQYERRTLPALRPPQDSAVEPGENSLNTEGYWRRSQTDWSLGAGQDYFDNDDSSRRRFLSSKGVDVWTKDALSLLHDTELSESSTDTNLKTLPVNGYFYFVEGATLKHTQDPSAASPSWTSVTLTGVGSSITSITTDGTRVYVADGSQIFESTVGSSSSTVLSSGDADYLFFCNGRLLAGHDNVLSEVAYGGTQTAIKTHDNTAGDWVAAVGAPNGIYAVYTVGDRSQTFYFGVDTTDGSLDTAVHAMPFPNGETILCLENYGDLVLVGSSAGFRVAIIESSNGLSHGPLVPIDGGVQDIDMQGQYAWFTWTNYDATSTGLGRLNLAEFTEPLVPAYSSDLMATDQGAVQSVSTFDDRVYFTVAEAGLYGQSDDLVSSGTLTSSKVRFSTSERKVVSSIDLRHDALAGTIGASVLSDSGDSASTSGSTTANSLGPPTPLALGTFTAEAFQTVLTLSRDATDTTTGPTFRRWTVRAIATPFRVEEFIVPIILKRVVEFGGADYSYDPYDEFLFLKGLESSRQVVRYQEGNATYNVYVDAVAIQRPDNWLPDNEFYEGVFLVRLITVETTT